MFRMVNATPLAVAQRTQRVLLIVLACLMSLWLVGCGGTTDAINATEPTPSSADDPLDEDSGQQPSGACPDATHWSDAGELIGSEATIVGPVTSTSYRPDVDGGPTFLNIGGDYGDPGIFTVVIWGEYQTRFATSPEEEFLHESICISGQVTQYEGVPQIEITRPEQIELNE